MPKFIDYYAVLAVASSASLDEIKSAYHRLALKYHPDHNPGDTEAEGRFKDINEAYAGLSSMQKRRTYQQLWENLRHGQEVVFPHDGGASFSGASAFSEFFHSLFGAENGGEGTSRTGTSAASSFADTYFVLRLSLAEALRGSREELSVCCGSVCPACGGSGLARYAPCPRCGGAGQLLEIKKAVISLPKGLRDGDCISVAALAHNVKVLVSPHPDFKVTGDDLETELRLAAGEAEMGNEALVPALDGVLRLKLPRNWRHGTKLRVPGRGLRKKDGTRGDLCVVLAADEESRCIPRQNRKAGGRWG